MSESTSMSIVDGMWAIWEVWKAVIEEENNVFTNSLVGTTIQDGGKRERSDVVTEFDDRK